MAYYYDIGHIAELYYEYYEFSHMYRTRNGYIFQTYTKGFQEGEYEELDDSDLIDWYKKYKQKKKLIIENDKKLNSPDKMAERLCEDALRLEQDGEFEKAEKLYKKAIKLDPNNTSYQKKLHNIKYGKSNINDTSDYGNEIIQNNKEKNEAKKYYYKALRFEKEGFPKSAIDFYEKAIVLDPNNEEYKNKLQKIKNKKV